MPRPRAVGRYVRRHPYRAVGYTGVVAQAGQLAYNAIARELRLRGNRVRTSNRRGAARRGRRSPRYPGRNFNPTGKRRRLGRLGTSGFSKSQNSHRAISCQPKSGYPYARSKLVKLVAYLEITNLFTFAATPGALAAILPLMRIGNAFLALSATRNEESSACVQGSATTYRQFETPRFYEQLALIYEKYTVRSIRYILDFRNNSSTNDLVLFWWAIRPHESNQSDFAYDIPYTQAGYDRLSRMDGVKCLIVAANTGNGYNHGKLNIAMKHTAHETRRQKHAGFYYSNSSSDLNKRQQNIGTSTTHAYNNDSDLQAFVWAFKRDASTGRIVTTVWNSTDGDNVTIEGKQYSNVAVFHPSIVGKAVDDDDNTA